MSINRKRSKMDTDFAENEQPPLKPLLDSPPITTDGQLVCEAPEGKQIKTCTFTIKVGEDKKSVQVTRGRKGHDGKWEQLQTPFNLVRPKGNTLNEGTSMSQTFANE